MTYKDPHGPTRKAEGSRRIQKDAEGPGRTRKDPEGPRGTQKDPEGPRRTHKDLRRTQKEPVRPIKQRQTGQAAFAASSSSSWFYCYPVNNVISRNIKLNMRMRRKGSNPSTMLMMMRTVMAAQREAVVARQMCWEQ